MTWEETDPVFDWMRSTWRHEERDEVLAVEKDPSHAPWDHGKGWQAVILPVDYGSDNSVTEYLARNVSEEEAVKVAIIYRENNA